MLCLNLRRQCVFPTSALRFFRPSRSPFLRPPRCGENRRHTFSAVPVFSPLFFPPRSGRYRAGIFRPLRCRLSSLPPLSYSLSASAGNDGIRRLFAEEIYVQPPAEDSGFCCFGNAKYRSVMIHRTAVSPAGENDGIRRFPTCFFLKSVLL